MPLMPKGCPKPMWICLRIAVVILMSLHVLIIARQLLWFEPRETPSLATYHLTAVTHINDVVRC